MAAFILNRNLRGPLQRGSVRAGRVELAAPLVSLKSNSPTSVPINMGRKLLYAGKRMNE